MPASFHSAPDSSGGAHSAPSNPLTVFGEGEEEGHESGEGKRKEKKT